MRHILTVLWLAILTSLYSVDSIAIPLSGEKELISFSFPAISGATGIINITDYSVIVVVPYSQNVNALVASFSSSPLSVVKVEGVVQTSGVTPNNFTITVTYRVQAENGSFRNYYVTVEHAPVSSQKQITAFSFGALVPAVTGTIDQLAHTIVLTVPSSVSRSSLAAGWSVSPLAKLYRGATLQSNPTVSTDFTGTVVYSVVAEDLSVQDYSVTASNAPPSSFCYLTSYTFAGLVPVVRGTIDQNANTVNLIVPFGTSVSALVASFVSSPNSTVTVGGVGQTSGITPNNFTSDKTCRVTAENGINYTDYVVHVAVSAAAVGNTITGFRFEAFNPDVIGAINQTDKTILLTVPYGTDVTSLVATFTSSPFSTIYIGGALQFSGVSVIDFSSPVVYKCIAQEGSFELYTVTVKAALPSTANKILTFSFEVGFEPHIYGLINDISKTILLTVPFSTDLTTIKASFTSSPFSSLTVNGLTQLSGLSINDFTNPVLYHCIAQDGSFEIYTLTVSRSPVRTGNDFLSFGFAGLPAAPEVYINQSNLAISVTIPYSTIPGPLAATFTVSPYASVSILGVPQVSGFTLHTFSDPVVYTVTAENGSSKSYTVTVTRAAALTGKDLTSFSFDGLVPPVEGVIDPLGGTVSLTVPASTIVTNLVATFGSSPLSTVKIGSYIQASGITPNNFLHPVIYTVRSESGSTRDYIVTVNKVALSSAKDITEFRFNALDPDVIGVIDQTSKTIELTVPFGTNLTNLVATFTNSQLSTVQVGPYIQTSGADPQDFSSVVLYDVFAEDGTFARYSVHVLISEMPKSFLDFTLAGSFLIGSDNVDFSSYGIINEAARTIQVNIPNAALKTSLTATFSMTPNTSAFIGGVAQASGVTSNDFTAGKTYRLQAADGSSITYVVNVTNRPIDTQKQIVSFSFNGVAPPIGCVINETAKSITAVFAAGTNIHALAASFSTSSSTARVKIGAARQYRGITVNDFTNPLVYRCIAEDDSYVNYTVTAIVQAPSGARQITDFRFNGLSAPAVGTIDETAGTILVTVPWAADIAHLVATFTLSPLASAKIGITPQTSGLTVNNFSSPVYYTVSAQNLTVRNYLVTVLRTPAATGSQILTFNFEAQFDPDIIGTIDQATRTINLVVPYSQNLTSLIASFTSSPYSSVFIGSTQQVGGTTPNSFTAPVTYTCRAENGLSTTYSVTISRAAVRTDNQLISFRINGTNPDALGVIDQDNYSVILHMPQSQQLSGLVATFTSSPMAKAYVGGVLQTSGLTANNFTGEVVYVIQAENGSTRNYYVDVVKDPVRTEKLLQTFSFESFVPAVPGVIDQNTRQITLHVPFTANLNSLTATFTNSYLSAVKVGSNIQVSGLSLNNFSVPVVYSVIAEDGSSQNYTVSVIRDPVSSARLMTDFRFNGLSADAVGTIDEESGYIIVTIPWSADINNLAASFVSSPLSAVRVGAEVQVSGITRHSFAVRVNYLVTAENGASRNYQVFVNRAPAATGNSLLSFNLENQFNPDIIGVIDQTAKTILLTVPFSRDVKGLIPSYTSSTSSSVYFESTLQVSGITPNNFTNPLIYTCRAEDGSTAYYTVSVVHAPASSAKDILDYRFASPDGNLIGAIDVVNRTVKVHVPYGTDITFMTPLFTLSPLATALVQDVVQVSGETPLNFSRPVLYRIISEDQADGWYTVTVIIDANKEKRLYSFDFNGLNPPVTGQIIEGAKAIQLNVPYSTSRSNLIATFTKSANATVLIGTTEQISGVTANNFTVPKSYIVKAQDNSTVVYTVTVTNDPASTEARITAFGFNAFTGSIGVIDETAGTITVSIPFEAAFTNLVATFTNSPLSTVKLGTVLQTSGVTANNFTNPLTYLVTSEIGLTKTYVVTVIKAPPATGNSIITFNFESQFDPDIIGTIDPVTRIVRLTVPFAQSVTSLVASFTSSPFSRLRIGSTYQVSGTTPNDFTNPVIYQCEAQDGSTELYEVRVLHAPASNLKEFLSFGFDGLLREASGVIDPALRTITVQVPGETDLTRLKARFTLSPLAIARVGGATQISGITSVDFTNPVEYHVIAEDNSERIYIVRVVAGLKVDKKILTFGFNGLGVPSAGVVDETAKTIVVYVPFSEARINLVATFTSSAGSTVWIGNTLQQSGITTNDFNSVTTYTVIAEDRGTQDYHVTVLKSPAQTGNQISSFVFNGLTPPVITVINQTARTITAVVPFGTALNGLVATFTQSLFATVTVIGAGQVSGITANDFSGPVVYRCTSESGLVNEYVVNVNVTAGSTGKDITYFAFEDLSPHRIGVISQTARTISIDVLAGTALATLRPTFTSSPKSTVSIAGHGIQVSGVSTVDFSFTVIYRVTAEDGTFNEYTVNVTVIPDTFAPVVVNPPQVVTNASGQYAVLQSNEATGKVYIIRSGVAQSTVADLEQAVARGFGRSAIVTQADTEIRITTYALDQAIYYTYAVDGAGNKSARGINSVSVVDVLAPDVYMVAQSITNAPSSYVNVRSSDNSGFVYLIMEGVPHGNRQQMDAAVGINKGQKAAVAEANIDTQVSAHLLLPGSYRAFAMDVNGNISAGSTALAEITAASHLNSMLSFSFNGLTPPASGQIIGNDIFIQVNPGTDRSSMVAYFTVSPQARVFVGLVQQVSGITPNKFINRVIYTVEAEDGTTQDYTVTVSFISSVSDQEWFSSIRVFPNPVSEKLNIEMTWPADRIEVFDALGQSVVDIEYPQKTLIQIDTGVWVQGFYYIRFFRNGLPAGVMKVIRQ